MKSGMTRQPDPSNFTADEFIAWAMDQPQGRFELGEVASEGFKVPRLEEQRIAVEEDEGAEAVPFGLVAPALAAGNIVRAFREHML